MPETILQLKHRLIRIYTIVTSLISLFVILTLALLNYYQQKAAQEKSFQTTAYSILSRIQSDLSISDSWLSENELLNHMMIYVSDNGSDLFFHGTYIIGSLRQELVDTIENQFIAEGYTPNQRPVSQNLIEGSVVSIRTSNGNNYLGKCAVVSVSNGYRTLFLAQETNSKKHPLFNFSLPYLLTGVFSVLLLYLVNRILVVHIIEPVKRSRQQQTEFIAAASHELRAPLTTIKSANELTSPVTKHDQQNKSIIDNECNRLSRLIGDMLLLTTQDAGAWTLNLVSLNPETLLIETYERYLPCSKKEGITLTIDFPQDTLPLIIGDSERLLQVLGILTDNALCYANSSGNPCIELSAVLMRKKIQFQIRDHGIGITEEAKPFVFERFYRCDKSHTDKTHSGLGLSIAKDLVTAQKGSIRLEDTPGGGCTFLIEMPLANS